MTLRHPVPLSTQRNIELSHGWVVCVCACLYACVPVCLCACTCTCVRVRARVYVSVCACARAHARILVCMHLFCGFWIFKFMSAIAFCIYSATHTHIRATRTNTRAQTYKHTCTDVHTYENILKFAVNAPLILIESYCLVWVYMSIYVSANVYILTYEYVFI